VRAGEPDLVAAETGVPGDEDLARRHRIAAEAELAHEAQHRGVAVRLHGEKRAEGECGEGALHALDLSLDGRGVVDVYRGAEARHDVECRDLSDIKNAVAKLHWPPMIAS